MRAVRVGPKGCPVCHEAHASCGPPSTSTPVDQPIQEAAVGGQLNRYKVITPSGVQTVMKLNAADAERLGGIPLDAEPAAQTPPQAKARPSAANKARTASPTKGGGGGGD